MEKAQVMIGDWELGASSCDHTQYDGLGPEVP